MKSIFDLKHAINNEEYFLNQFSDEKRKEKNILYVNPQLSETHLYKILLPVLWSISNPEYGVATAVTGLSEYNEENQLFGAGGFGKLTDEMISWATSIVIPFTAQPLVVGLYARIREINPDASIVYMVDFNFYELDEEHPYAYIFKEDFVIDDIEDNIYHCDMVLVSNFALQDYLHKVIEELIHTKYKNTIRKSNNLELKIECQQLYTDINIVLENVEYAIQPSISNKSIKQKNKHLDDLSSFADKQITIEAEIKKLKGKTKEKDNYKGKPINSKKIKKAIKKSTDKKPKNNGRSKGK